LLKEPNQLSHFWQAFDFALHSLDGLRHVHVRAEEESVRALELSDRPLFHPAALEADGVQAVQPDRISNCLEEWRNVLRHARTAADETVPPDAYELVHRAQSRHDHPVFHDHVTRKLRDIRKDDVVTDVAVVRKVDV